MSASNSNDLPSSSNDANSSSSSIEKTPGKRIDPHSTLYAKKNKKLGRMLERKAVLPITCGFFHQTMAKYGQVQIKFQDFQLFEVVCLIKSRIDTVDKVIFLIEDKSEEGKPMEMEMIKILGEETYEEAEGKFATVICHEQMAQGTEKFNPITRIINFRFLSQEIGEQRLAEHAILAKRAEIFWEQEMTRRMAGNEETGFHNLRHYRNHIRKDCVTRPRRTEKELFGTVVQALKNLCDNSSSLTGFTAEEVTEKCGFEQDNLVPANHENVSMALQDLAFIGNAWSTIKDDGEEIFKYAP